jgi:cysteinyl-tRNA synthetase
MPYTIQLHDTLSRTNKPLKASNTQRFRFYCCGPTVYGAAHIGNFRTFAVQDVLRRLLEALNMHPYHVRNLTDVDDKTIRRSMEEKVSLSEFTKKWTDRFHEDCKRLNLLPPHEEPSAVEFIPQQIAMIEQLVANKHAYVAEDGSVYYRVCAFHDYGKLAHLDREHLQTQSTNSAGTVNAADEYERECIADFALWKAYKSEDGPNAWDSPWGKGRPGWHIECSAMSMHYFGATMDLHCGGIDLCFPHHENEIAQSEGVTGKTFSNHWFHSAHLMVEGQKMSKKLGNLFTIADLEARGYSDRVVRYLLISGHYSQPLNFTFDGLKAAESALQKLVKTIEDLLKLLNIQFETFAKQWIQAKPIGWSHVKYFNPVMQALCDDLNTPAALGELFKSLKQLHEEAKSLPQAQLEAELAALGQIAYIFGLDLLTQYQSEQQKKSIEAPESIQQLAHQRWQAKQNRNFQEADQLRVTLKEQGWLVHDSKDAYELEFIGK